MTKERKLSDADRMAMENLQLRSENLQLAEQNLVQQLNALQPMKQTEQRKRAIFNQYLAATYAYDPSKESVRQADGAIVPNEPAPAAPEPPKAPEPVVAEKAPAIALVTGRQVRPRARRPR